MHTGINCWRVWWKASKTIDVSLFCSHSPVLLFQIPMFVQAEMLNTHLGQVVQSPIKLI